MARCGRRLTFLLYLSSDVSEPQLVKACVLQMVEVRIQGSFWGLECSPSCAVGDVVKGLISPKGRVCLAGSRGGVRAVF